MTLLVAWFGSGFACSGGIFLWPTVVGRVYRLLELVGEGCPGHGPVHLLVASASEVGFQWDPLALGWSRPALFSILGLPFLMPGVLRLRLIFAVGRVSGGGPLLYVFGSLQLLNSADVGEREKALLMVGGVWNGFLLGRVKGLYLAGSVVLLKVMVTFSGTAPFLLSLRFVKILSFMIS